MSGNWQPINTAPKNEAGQMFGPTILIYYRVDDLPWPSYWGPNLSAPAEGCWLSCDENPPFDEDYVTHWQPLPSAPDA